MKRTAMFSAIAAVTLLVGCDGPQENAGEKVDASASGAAGNPMVSGPAETAGEIRDRATQRANRAAEDQADALEDQAQQLRDEAERKADAAEDRADAVRSTVNSTP